MEELKECEEVILPLFKTMPYGHLATLGSSGTIKE